MLGYVDSRGPMLGHQLQVFKGVAVLKGEKVSVAVKLYTTKFTDLTHRQIFDVGHPSPRPLRLPPSLSKTGIPFHFYL
jgi:hypothetical protein